MNILYHVRYWSPPTALVRHPLAALMHLRIRAPRASSMPSSFIIAVPKAVIQTPFITFWHYFVKHRLTLVPSTATGETHAPWPQAMPALLSLRRAATCTPCYSLHRASGVREELLWGSAQSFPGCRGAPAADRRRSMRPCSPARTNTTLFQRPSWDRLTG